MIVFIRVPTMGALFRACYFHTLPAFIRVNAFMHGHLDTNYLHTGVRIHLGNDFIRVPSIRVPCKVPPFLRVSAFFWGECIHKGTCIHHGTFIEVFWGTRDIVLLHVLI